MNVLMLVSWYSPKAVYPMTTGVFHYEQSIALQKYCNVALYYPYDTDLEMDFCEGVEQGLLTFRRKRDKGKVEKYLHFIKDYRKIKKVFKPDIIHAHVGAQAGLAAVILGKLFGVPVVITEHLPIEMARLDEKKVKKNTGYVYKNSKANVCVSPDSMRRLQEIFPKERFSVIYNGVINPNQTQCHKNDYRNKPGIHCCIVAGFYSRDIKGYQYLLPAIKELVLGGMNITLHICGGGTYLEHYKNMAHDLGISENCVFYGQCDRNKVYEIVAQMDFNISASVYECSGVSVQEAMLLGKPLVVTKSGGANSLVTDDTAIVVERESVNALVEGIQKMVVSYANYNAEKIKNYAFANFEIDQVSKQYMDLYKSIMK